MSEERKIQVKVHERRHAVTPAFDQQRPKGEQSIAWTEEANLCESVCRERWDALEVMRREKRERANNLLLILLSVVTASGLSGGTSTLALNTTGTGTTVRRGEGKVDVLLRVKTNDERGDVDDLLADTDVTLDDQDTGVVDRLGKAGLEDLSLQTTLKEILDLEGEHVIETHAGLVEHTDAHQTANDGVTLEETLGVLLVELEELTGGTTDLGESEGNAPDLTLVTETVLTTSLSSLSRRADSKGRRGTLAVLDCLRGARGILSTKRDNRTKEKVRQKEQGGQQEGQYDADGCCLFVHARVKALEMLSCLDQVTLGFGTRRKRVR